MIIDNLLILDPNPTSVLASQASTNVIDLGADRDISVGDAFEPKLELDVVTAFATTTSATLQVQFETSPDNATWTVLDQSPVYSAAQLGVGRIWPIDVPGGIQRYIRLGYVVGTGSFTAGQVTAALIIDRANATAYPSGYSNQYV